VIRIVVDASVLVACALSDGKSRKVLFNSAGVEFYSPEFVLEELRRKSPKIIALSGIPPNLLTSLIDDLIERVNVVPYQGYGLRMEEALNLTNAVDAHGDEDYVALALALDAPIWSYDKDFRRIRRIEVVGIDQVVGLSE
jgi:predicted nucleic acid-binding protein